MKKGFVIAITTLLLVALIVTLGIRLFTKDENLQKSNEYLEDPESYMEELKEKYQGGSEEHEHEDETHEKPLEYYESLRDEWQQEDKLIVTDENYIPMMVVIDKYHDSFEGKRIELIGFVYREPEFTENQFVVGRRADPCCTENAEGIYGLLSTSPSTSNFEDNQWVKVKGTLSKMEYFEIEVPYLLIEDIKEIEPPSDPYVYESE
jgi:putative membrane protein